MIGGMETITDVLHALVDAARTIIGDTVIARMHEVIDTPAAPPAPAEPAPGGPGA
jgi:hypothetical protein